MMAEDVVVVAVTILVGLLADIIVGFGLVATPLVKEGGTVTRPGPIPTGTLITSGPWPLTGFR